MLCARSRPRVYGLFVALAVMLGMSMTLASPSNASPTGTPGFAWAWGGTLGNGSATDSNTPVAVSMSPGVRFTAISAGNGDDLAVDSTGHAWAWGGNLYGELGDGTTTGTLVPVPVSTPPGVTFTAISAGDQGLTSDSLALDSTGHAWAWGYNGSGELGDGTTSGPDSCSGKPCSTTPVEVSVPAGVTFTAISAGDGVSVAIDSSGDAWAWGSNSDGELGDGTNTNSSVPVQVSMPTGVMFTQISAGGEAILALDSSGNAWGWGFNGDGELGNGRSTDSSVPTAVLMPPGVTFTSIDLGSFNSLALDGIGHVWAWGTNQFGLLGEGTTGGQQVCSFPACSTSPVAVDTPDNLTFTALSAGQVDDLLLSSTGQAWAWGDNDEGQLGIGNSTGPDMCSGLPCSLTPQAVLMPAGVTFTSVSEGNETSLALSPGARSKAATTTVISSSPDPVVVGGRVTYTATVKPAQAGTSLPTGTVGFSDNGTPLRDCTAVAITAGQATCTTTYSSTGSHIVVATYSGDASFAASASSELGEAVTRCFIGTFGCDLAGADLLNSDLAGQAFVGDDLAQADLSGADARGTVIFFTNIDRANLTGADFSDAKLVFVNLAHANLTNADFSGSTLYGVNVSGVTWSNTTCPDATQSNADGGTCVGHL